MRTDASEKIRRKVSVIVPSRLSVNPISIGHATPSLYLDLSVCGILRQTADVDLEIIIGIDKGQRSKIPARLLEKGKVPLLFVESKGAGQAAAVNAAASRATGDVIAFCEDDDLWEPEKLGYQLPLLDKFDLVTCNQRERTPTGDFVRYNHFACPSTWVMKCETWERVKVTPNPNLPWWRHIFPARLRPGFDESFRFHVDTEWLGRANALGLKRAHLVHNGYATNSWLEAVARHSVILRTDGVSEPLVHRMVNPEGGMATIARDAKATETSKREHEIMLARFTEIPW